MFSSRVPGDLRPNRLAQATRRARASKRRLLDLTASNPTQVGIRYPESLLTPLATEASRSYDPSPFGLETARAAVAADYARRGIAVAKERIVLTASTSEAYSLLFKLLCEPAGNAVLVPVPSYPLFDHLTRLDGVGASPYPLEYHGRWMVDVVALDAVWSNSIRAALAVSPNNPTGSTLSEGELDALATRCAARDAALIIDEVFADYPLENPHPGTLEPLNPHPGTLEPLNPHPGTLEPLNPNPGTLEPLNP
jgi:aspartate/methionine/tyrosine aminotransferase